MLANFEQVASETERILRRYELFRHCIELNENETLFRYQDDTDSLTQLSYRSRNHMEKYRKIGIQFETDFKLLEILDYVNSQDSVTYSLYASFFFLKMQSIPRFAKEFIAVSVKHVVDNHVVFLHDKQINGSDIDAVAAFKLVAKKQDGTPHIPLVNDRKFIRYVQNKNFFDIDGWI